MVEAKLVEPTVSELDQAFRGERYSTAGGDDDDPYPLPELDSSNPFKVNIGSANDFTAESTSVANGDSLDAVAEKDKSHNKLVYVFLAVFFGAFLLVAGGVSWFFVQVPNHDSTSARKAGNAAATEAVSSDRRSVKAKEVSSVVGNSAGRDSVSHRARTDPRRSGTDKHNGGYGSRNAATPGGQPSRTPDSRHSSVFPQVGQPAIPQTFDTPRVNPLQSPTTRGRSSAVQGGYEPQPKSAAADARKSTSIVLSADIRSTHSYS